jgi:Rrf2 family protein
MIKLNKKVEYALMVLKHMADKGDGELSTAREICDKYNIPFDTTAKVMQQMNNADILLSTKGVKGGYTLNTNLDHISYLQLSELVEGKNISIDCEDSNCSLISTCNISRPIKRLNEYLMYFFKDLTLKELLQDHNLGPLGQINKVTNK